MSDPLVIAAFTVRLSSVLDPVTEPLIETINVRPNLPPVYVSIERDYSAVERITLSMPLTQFREYGSLSIVVTTPAGVGTTDAEVLAEKIRDAFHNYAAGFLHIESVGSAAVVEPDDGNYFQMKVPVQYQFDFFK